MSTWSISSQALWQHGIVELILSIIVFLIIKNEQKSDVKNIIFIGALSGLFVFNRPSEIILLLPVLTYVFFLKDKRILYYMVSALAISAPFLIYNYYYFGNFSGGYGSAIYTFVFNGSIVSNFLGLLFSPSRGLIVYTPIVLFSLVGLHYIKKLNNDRIKLFLYVSAIAILLDTIVYSCYSIWWAGWSYGPRYLTGIQPLLIIFIALSLPKLIDLRLMNKKQSATLAVFTLFLVISICIQAIGAFYYDCDWDASPVNIDNSPERLWDLQDTQIIRSLSSGPAPLTLLNILSIKYDEKDDIRLLGAYGIEKWGNNSTQWIANSSSIMFNSPGADNVTISFNALSFYKNRTAQIYLNERLVHEQLISTNGSYLLVPLSLKNGLNNITISTVEGGQRPCDIPQYDSIDNRTISLAIKDINME
jgi:hypothetical protein